MSLEYDHRQKHPGSLYSDENHTHFNTPNGVVEVPRPLLLGSDDWKIAQFAQKKTEAESEGQPLTSAQIKRTKQGIAKTAKSYNEAQFAQEKLAEETAQAELLRKQRRKDAKKKRMQETTQNKHTQKLAALAVEANTLYQQCEKLNIELLISPSATNEYVIETCKKALLKYMNTPLTEEELKTREEAASKQKANINADARAKEIFLDGKTNHVVANQMVEGEQFQLPQKKKKTNKNKNSFKPAPLKQLPDVKIDWGEDVKIDWGEDVKMGEKLSKKQRREIAAANRAADSA
jgi:hypothetical protein